MAFAAALEALKYSHRAHGFFSFSDRDHIDALSLASDGRDARRERDVLLVLCWGERGELTEMKKSQRTIKRHKRRYRGHRGGVDRNQTSRMLCPWNEMAMNVR